MPDALPRRKAGKVREKYGGLMDRVSYYFPFVPGQSEDGWRVTIAGFKP